MVKFSLAVFLHLSFLAISPKSRTIGVRPQHGSLQGSRARRGAVGITSSTCSLCTAQTDAGRKDEADNVTVVILTLVRALTSTKNSQAPAIHLEILRILGLLPPTGPTMSTSSPQLTTRATFKRTTLDMAELPSTQIWYRPPTVLSCKALRNRLRTSSTLVIQTMLMSHGHQRTAYSQSFSASMM